MRFDIITIFPHIFDSYINESLVKRAREKKVISINVHNLRDYSKGRHQKVDDKPFGGGPGMVLQVEPITRAVQKIKAKNKKTRVVLFSTRGKTFEQKTARRLSKYDQIIMICGRYEGVDERVAEHIADEEISMGEYVLSGGELPALVLLEATARFLPGFLGKQESLEDIKGYYPTYTRPPETVIKGKKRRVPEVLTSGNHALITAWRHRLGKRK
ncbi:MAG: tRNA (guanosine(37)-N1)-methyltransferase TrmD [Patescibacteria group bacterium]